MKTEIKINLEKLEGEIKKPRDLAESCSGIDTAEKSVVGGGQSINMVTALDKEYADLKQALKQLIENSAGFFENIRNSAISADEEAAGKIR